MVKVKRVGPRPAPREEGLEGGRAVGIFRMREIREDFTPAGRGLGFGEDQLSLSLKPTPSVHTKPALRPGLKAPAGCPAPCLLGG